MFPYESGGCNTAELKEIVWCTGQLINTNTIHIEMPHGEECVQYIDKRYLTSECRNGEWERIKAGE